MWTRQAHQSGRSRRATGAGMLLAIVLLAGSAPAGRLARAQASTSGDLAPPCTACPDWEARWRVVPSPSPGAAGNYLDGVAVVNEKNVWAVGYAVGPNNIPQTLIEHWTGRAWSVVPSPNVGTNRNYLHAVAVVGPGDIWAAGFYWDAGNVQRTLIEHWNGAQWTVVVSPNAGPHENYLQSLTVLAANDIWAVGLYSPEMVTYQTLTEHWNGSQWSVVASPNAGDNENYLYGMAAVASDDIWAVGYFSNYNAPQQSLVEHWNGSQWSIVPVPGVGNNRNYFKGIAATGPADVWAVGFYWNADNVQQTLAEHWNGIQWSVIPSPSNGTHENYLNSVTALGPNDVWAAGLYSPDMVTYQTLIEHWNGLTWTIVSSPNAGSRENYLNSIAAVNHDNVWAVGYSSDSTSGQQTLVQQFLRRRDDLSPQAR